MDGGTNGWTDGQTGCTVAQHATKNKNKKKQKKKKKKKNSVTNRELVGERSSRTY